MFSKSLWQLPALSLLVLSAACGGQGEAAPAANENAATAEAPAAPAAAAPAAGGQVIEVKMIMGTGQPVFEPAQVTAKPGDIVRFVNVDNVHNVSFPADKNAGVAGALPAPSPYMATPGQTYDLKVELQPGTYTFQCDPHAAMGMVGQLTVAQ